MSKRIHTVAPQVPPINRETAEPNFRAAEATLPIRDRADDQPPIAHVIISLSGVTDSVSVRRLTLRRDPAAAKPITIQELQR